MFHDVGPVLVMLVDRDPRADVVQAGGGPEQLPLHRAEVVDRARLVEEGLRVAPDGRRVPAVGVPAGREPVHRRVTQLAGVVRDRRVEGSEHHALAQAPLAVGRRRRAERAERRGQDHRAGRQQIGAPFVDAGQREPLLGGRRAQHPGDVVQRRRRHLELVEGGRRLGPAPRGEQPDRPRRPCRRRSRTGGRVARRSPPPPGSAAPPRARGAPGAPTGSSDRRRPSFATAERPRAGTNRSRAMRPSSTSAISRLPPPRSKASHGPGGNAMLARIPVTVHRASSSPARMSIGTPSAPRSALEIQGRFAASRNAAVATGSTRSAPERSATSRNRETISRARSSISSGTRPVAATSAPRLRITRSRRTWVSVPSGSASVTRSWNDVLPRSSTAHRIGSARGRALTRTAPSAGGGTPTPGATTRAGRRGRRPPGPRAIRHAAAADGSSPSNPRNHMCARTASCCAPSTSCRRVARRMNLRPRAPETGVKISAA